MAFTPLSTFDLAYVDANVRSQAGALSEQESEVYAKQMVDIIHHAVLFIRSLLGKFAERDYSTTVVPTEVVGWALPDGHFDTYVNISTYDIFDLNRITLRDKTNGNIGLVSDSVFSSRISLGTATKLRRYSFGTVTNLMMGTDTKLGIQIYRGKSITAGTLEMKYPRNPDKALVAATKIDMLNRYIPLLIDMATVAVIRKIKNAVPGSELEQRVAASLNFIGSQRGISVTPSNS